MRMQAHLAAQTRRHAGIRNSFARALASVLRPLALAIAGPLVLAAAPSVAQMTVTSPNPASISFAHPSTSGSVTIQGTDVIDASPKLTWTVQSNALHGSVAFDNNVCPLVNGSTAAFTCPVTYTLTQPTYLGVDSFILLVCDQFQQCANVTVNEQITPSPPTANNFTIQTTDKAQASVDLLAAGEITVDPSVSPKLVVVSITAGPAHGAVAVAGTQITYTPSGNYIGSDSLTYQVSDGSPSTASAVMTISVRPSSAVTATNFPIQDTDNTAVPIDLTQNNRITYDPVDLSHLITSVTAAPAHGSTSVVGTTITYTPLAGYIGNDALTYQVTDGVTSASGTISITVKPAAALTATNFSAQDTDNTALPIDLTQNGRITFDPNDLKRISVSVIAAPAHGAANAAGTTITYTPSAGYIGADVFTYQISDGFTTASGTIAITVKPSAAVTATNFSVQGTDNTALAISLTQNNRITFDPNDLNRLNVSVIGAPAHGSTGAAGTTITYTPSAGYIGADALTYQVSDGFTTASGTITIAVKPSSAVTATNFSVTDTDNTALPINLTQNNRIGFDPNDQGHLSVTVTAAPAHGTANVNGTTIAYNPSAGFVGSDRLTYSVSDGNSSASGTITITVKPSTALTATSFSVQATDGTPLAVDLTQKNRIGFDPADASHLVVKLTAAPAHGAASASGTTITYTGSAGYAGSDKLTYQVSDGFTSASGTISVTDTPRAIAVPANIIGKPQATATATLVAAGFTVTTVSQMSTAVPYGDVITSVPAPGTMVLPHTVVKLVISQGVARQANAPLSSVPGLSPGEISVAQALERACKSIGGAISNGTAVTAQQRDLFTQCSALISDYGGGQNEAGLKKALDAISGRQVTAPQRTALQFSAGQLANMSARLAELRLGGSSFSMAGLDLGLPGNVESAYGPLLGLAKELFGGGAGDDKNSGPGSRLGMFITGTFRRGSESTSNSELGFDFKNDGVTVGVDYRFTDRLIFGLAGGYGTTSTTYDDQGSKLDSKSSGFSLYGTYFRDRFYVDLLAGFMHNSYDLSRQASFQSSSNGVGCGGGNCSVETSSSTSAHEWTISGATGVDFGSGGLAIGPELALDYARIDVSGFTEGGPSGLALTFSPQSAESLVLKAGGHVSYAWTTSWAVISPQARVRWLHEFLNDSYAAPIVFTADTLTPVAQRSFVAYTNSPDRNYLDWNLSLAFQFPHGISGFVNYGQLGGLQYINMREFNIGLRFENRFH
jgi:large repetitive protein